MRKLSQLVRMAAVGPLVVEGMRSAAALAVPLEVELGEGSTWGEAH